MPCSICIIPAGPVCLEARKINQQLKLICHFMDLDQMPYLNYPSRWPTYTPAVKYGNWLELYAETLDLKYWTGCQVTSCKQVSLTNEWTVEVNRCQGKDGRKTLKAKHVVMATGFAGRPKMPKFPGMDSFEGEIRHSTQHHSAKGCEGKKMLVVGTGASGLDIALEASKSCKLDLSPNRIDAIFSARRGLDVTILQRSPTYVMSLTNGVAKVRNILSSRHQCSS